MTAVFNLAMLSGAPILGPDILASGRCPVGHDLTGKWSVYRPGTARGHGRCRRCTQLRCRRGHDLSDPVNIARGNVCRTCDRLRQRLRYRRSVTLAAEAAAYLGLPRSPKPKPPKQPRKEPGDVRVVPMRERVLVDTTTPQPWPPRAVMDHGACGTRPPELFEGYDRSSGETALTFAKRVVTASNICAGCPVRNLCAVSARESFRADRREKRVAGGVHFGATIHGAAQFIPGLLVTDRDMGRTL